MSGSDPPEEGNGGTDDAASPDGTQDEPEQCVQRLDEREQRLDRREQELDQREQELDQREQEFDQREQEVLERREETVELREELEAETERTEQRERELDQREGQLDERKRELDRRAEELDEREAALERYVGRQLSDLEESLAETVWESTHAAVSEGDGSSGPVGTIRGLLLGLAGIVLIVLGVTNGLVTQIPGVPALFTSTLANVGTSAVLLFVGLAANLAAVAGRV